ncbi:hypothetical protein AN958_01948 [Leucoagaricus sp. SymC.cos]|nr:hypothetical protein AN958_01948 [Leucoagaricus sp. SymC.cos]
MSVQVSSGQTYKITNVKSGTVVDLSGVDNHTIIGYPYHNGQNQHWTFNWTGKAWTIRSVSSGQYLGTDSTNYADGTKLVAVAQPFEWHIWRDDANQNTFRIFVPFTHFNVDLNNYGSPIAGEPISLWWTWEGLHQTWKIESRTSSLSPLSWIR